MLLYRSLIGGQNIRCNGRGEVARSEKIDVEIREAALFRRTQIARQVGSTSALCEDALILGTREACGWSNTHPNAPIVTNRHVPARSHGNDRQCGPIQNTTLNRERWERQNSTIIANARELLKKFISDRKVGRAAVIAGSDKKDARLLVSRQIVCETTDGATRLITDIAAVALFTFYAVAFQILQERN